MTDHSNSLPAGLQDLCVLVAIPTLNEELTIRAILQGLAKEKAHLPNLSIVVADGGSHDRTCALVEEQSKSHHFITVVQNRKRLQSAAINLVARQWRDKADILIRCDAHAHYPEAFLLNLVVTLMKTGADSVVVPMDSVGRDCVEKAVAWVSDTPFGSGGSAHRGGQQSGFVDHGHHAAFRIERFLENGGYDESFSHNEDAEFDCRLNAVGGKIYLDANIRLQYYPRNSLTRLWKQYFNYGIGRSRTVRRHPHTMRLRQVVVPMHFALTALSVIAALLAGSWLFLAWPFLYFAVLAAVSAMLAMKHKSVCGLLGGAAAAVMHFSWASGFFWGLVTAREKRWRMVSAAA